MSLYAVVQLVEQACSADLPPPQKILLLLLNLILESKNPIILLPTFLSYSSAPDPSLCQSCSSSSPSSSPVVLTVLDVGCLVFTSPLVLACSVQSCLLSCELQSLSFLSSRQRLVSCALSLQKLFKYKANNSYERAPKTHITHQPQF